MKPSLLAFLFLALGAANAFAHGGHPTAEDSEEHLAYHTASAAKNTQDSTALSAPAAASLSAA